MTTQRVSPSEPVPAPATGGGKIAVDPPIIAPPPPPRSIWGIAVPAALVVVILGIVIGLYVTGMRTLAGGTGFMGFMGIGLIASYMMRGRGAGHKMTWGELLLGRRRYFNRLDDVRDEVDIHRRSQWEHRVHYHWDPAELIGAVSTPRMWERRPGSPAFAVARVGTGKVRLAMEITPPTIAESTDIEHATGHALRKFLIEQQYIDDTPKAIWLQRFPGLSIVGDTEPVRALARSMICQIAAFHNPADVQVIIVTAAPNEWEWCKWLPHLQHQTVRDGCGERRLLFTSPGALEAFLDEAETERAEWTAPAMSDRPQWNPGPAAVAPGPLRVIIDDGCGSQEDWAGLTGSAGYADTCFVRLASSPPATSPTSFGAKHWIGFDPATTYRLGGDGILRKRLPIDNPDLLAGGEDKTQDSDELDDVFRASADQMSIAAAESFALALASYRSGGSAATPVEALKRALLDVLGIRDPRTTDIQRIWSQRRVLSRDWMRFPIGVDTDGQIVWMDLKESSQGGWGMHSLFIGITGSGKSEGIKAEVAAATLLHSPEDLTIVFSDYKMHSAAGVLERFPHVQAAVSNLKGQRHLVGRMYEAVQGELDRRGQLVADLSKREVAAGRHAVVDMNDYQKLRLTDPNLDPVPVLWFIADEHQEMLKDPDWGPKYRELFDRMSRQGRSYWMFLQLVSQTVDTQQLRDIRKNLGYVIAARTGSEEESRNALGSGYTMAAKLPEGEDGAGTAILRVAQRVPTQFRFFHCSEKFIPPADDEDDEPIQAGTWFDPRPFTLTEAEDPDELLAKPPAAEQARIAEREKAAAERAAASGEKLIVDVIIEALQAQPQRPPRQLWLPPLGIPPTADDLVFKHRGKAWDEDYGNNPGLTVPVALQDKPREHKQDVLCLDLLNDNAMIVAAPKRGATNAVMTMVTCAALMYRPERVQFYVVAASGPQLAAVDSIPHVAMVAPAFDVEGVNRLLATVESIVEDRERMFAARGLDMTAVREAKFGRQEGGDIGVEGGDVVVIVDGWANFSEALPKHESTVMRLMRARNYGVRVVLTHTSHTSGLRSGIRTEIGHRLELRLTDPRETEVERVAGVNRAREVPDTPGRGLSPTGHHLMVGVPELDPPTGRVPVREVGTAIRAVAGDNVTRVLRLPESIAFKDIQEQVPAALPDQVVPFGLSENTLGPVYVDFNEHAHVVAAGRSGSGRTNWLRVMMRSIMNRYSPQEATIVLFDRRRKLVGVVPDEWLSRYAYQTSDIKTVIDGVAPAVDARGQVTRAASRGLADILADRQPPPGTSQTDLLTWQAAGRHLFVVVDDITSWSPHEHPLAGLASYVDQADQLKFHVIATAEIGAWSSHAQSTGRGVLSRVVTSLAPVLVLDGRRPDGQIMPGVWAEPQRPGKGLYVRDGGSDVEGVLVGWSPPAQ